MCNWITAAWEKLTQQWKSRILPFCFYKAVRGSQEGISKSQYNEKNCRAQLPAWCVSLPHTHTHLRIPPAMSTRHAVTWGQRALSPCREPGTGAQNWSPEPPQCISPATLCLRWNATSLLCLIRSWYSRDTSLPPPGSLATQLTPCPRRPLLRIQVNMLHHVTSCFNIFSNLQGVKKNKQILHDCCLEIQQYWLRDCLRGSAVKTPASKAQNVEFHPQSESQDQEWPGATELTQQKKKKYWCQPNFQAK